jgi:murein DD-endopeptidase MepM/ murein hydrolase activator NlpD
LRQYRTSLTASRFVADPAAPELKPRFEYRFGGPAAVEAPAPLPDGNQEAYPEWDDYPYSRSENEWTGDEWAGDEWTGDDHPIEFVEDEYPAAPDFWVQQRGNAVADDDVESMESTTTAHTQGHTTAAIKDSHFDGPQVLDIAQPMQHNEFTNVLATGKQFAKDRAAREAALMRPQFVLFAHGTYTSGFGFRWGAMHAGVDVAAPIGTPIYAVADGTVIDAGPASGFGMWVRLRHSDGTITVYGHVNTATVSVGQHVTAGDQIATVGNRGYSTGPHCHFEVWQNGVTKIDPLPWLASRGISLGPEED